MNSKTWTRIIALTLFAALVLSLQLAAQTNTKQLRPHRYHHYQIVDPGTFGGPSSGLQNPPFPRVGVLNNSGTLVGAADGTAVDPFCGNPPNCLIFNAFQWQNGVTNDLGVLPGGFTSQSQWISENGLIVGLGDNGQWDPVAGFPLLQLHGILWEHGGMTDLGTLPEGGYLSFPNGVNNRGEVVGSAQNLVPDANSMNPGYGTQTRAFYWKNGVMQDIGTLGTGTDAQAALINERGQVVGWSYTNSTPSAICAGQYNWGFFLTTGSFIWDKHHGMRDIGGLGGTCTLAQDLNNRGQIVGDSALTGDTLLHPFVWDSATGMTDLGTASGNYGEARAINEHGDVVGQVCDAAYSSCPAALWQKAGGKWGLTNLGTIVIGGCAKSTSVNASAQVVGTDWCAGLAGLPFLSENGGPVVDLNTLVPPNSGIQLVEGVQINDRGEIAVQGPDANGNNHAVLLIPCDENHPDVSGCDYDLIDAETAAARSSQNPAQHPEASTPGTRTPGMLNRFRSPKNRPAPGRLPAPGASLAHSAAPVSTDWLADHLSAPQYGPSLYCQISSGALTGACVQTRGVDTCSRTFNGCPAGQPASESYQQSCPSGNPIPISNVLCFSVPGFDLSASALTPTTVSPGGSATSTLTVSGYGGFGGSVTFTCSVQQTATLAPTCSFSPSSAKSGTPTTLTVSTTAPTSALRTGIGSGLFYAFFLSLSGLIAMALRFGPEQKRRGKFTAAALACMLFAYVVFQAACGAKATTPGTPAGSYTITVTGTDSSGNLVSSTAMPPLYVQ